MILKELLIAMEIDLHTYAKNINEVIQIESGDGIYLDIKEVYFLDKPVRTIIRTISKPDRFPYEMTGLAKIKEGTENECQQK